MEKKYTVLSEFASQFPLKSFRRNETVFFQDDPATTIYYVKSGFIKAYDIDVTGAEQLLGIIGKGDFTPVATLFEDEPTIPYFFTAFSAVEAYAIPRAAFLQLLDTDSHALHEVTNILALRLSNTYHHLNAAEKVRADDKIAYGLYFLSRSFSNLPSKASPPVTQQDIASLIGLSRETVSQELKKLKDQGLIYYDKYRFTIHQDKLKEIL